MSPPQVAPTEPPYRVVLVPRSLLSQYSGSPTRSLPPGFPNGVLTERVAPSTESPFNYFSEFPVNGHIRPLSSLPLSSWIPRMEPPNRALAKKDAPFPEPSIHLLIYICRSLQCGALPQQRGIILIYQADPLYLVRINTTGRSPSIPEGAVNDRLTHCHSSLTYCTHTVWRYVFQGLYSFRFAVFCVTGPPLVGCGSSPRTDSLGWREAMIRIYHPRRIATAPPPRVTIDTSR
jgi:hypothetical protein